MALLNTVTTITIGWVFDGEVKHLSSKINNLTQTLSWSITDILLIVYLSFTQKLVYFKKPWLTGFYSYFKLCGTIGSDLSKQKFYTLLSSSLVASLPDGKVAEYLYNYWLIKTVINTNFLKTSNLHVALNVWWFVWPPKLLKTSWPPKLPKSISITLLMLCTLYFF